MQKANEILREQQKPVGTLKPGMTGKQKIFVLVLAILCLGLGGGIAYLTTAQVNDLKADGKNYSTLVPGSPGVDGKSAYQIAVEQGFQGSEQEWLDTLRGAQGDEGQPGLSAYQLAQVQGYLGTQTDWLQSLVGDRGRSAYEIAVDNGFQGTQLEWLASLIGVKGQKGDAGASAYAVAVINGYTGTQSQWLASLKGDKGDKGDTGATGAPGADGANGTNGVDGRDPVLSCVVRTTNGLRTQYVAWKYATEADAAYRNLYKLPTWAQGENCVDLTAGA